MQKNNKYSLIQINDITIEEKIGSIFVTIKPGAHCIFNKLIPSNARHYHHCYELCIVTDGYGIFIYDGKKIPIKKGDVFISDPDVLHEITISPNSLTGTDNELELFHFSINLQKSDASSKMSKQEQIINMFLKKHHVIRKSQHQLFAYLNFLFTFTRNREITNNKTAVDFGLENAIKGIVYNSLIILTEQVKTGAKEITPSNIIDNALQYIGTHLNEKITLDALSSYCNTSKRNLQLLFHQYLDSTIIDYINNRRMALASSYLRMNFRVSDVGPNIGIDDPAQFCRIFKKYYGLSPKKYQTEYKTNGMIFGADYK